MATDEEIEDLIVRTVTGAPHDHARASAYLKNLIAGQLIEMKVATDGGIRYRRNPDPPEPPASTAPGRLP